MLTRHEADLGVRTAAERGTRPTSRHRAGACRFGDRERRIRGRDCESGGLNLETPYRPIARLRFTSRPSRCCAIACIHLRASMRCAVRARARRVSSVPTHPPTQASGVTDESARASLVGPERTGRARMVRTTGRARDTPLRRPARPLRAAAKRPFCHFSESIKPDPVPRAARFTSLTRCASATDQAETRGSWRRVRLRCLWVRQPGVYRLKPPPPRRRPQRA